MLKPNQFARNPSNAKLYALLANACPHLLTKYTRYFSTPEKVGAELILASGTSDYTLLVASHDQADESFQLDLGTRSHQSRGDWRWISNISIYHCHDLLLDVTMTPRVIDLPYCKQRINAYWLLHYIEHELDLNLSQLFSQSLSD